MSIDSIRVSIEQRFYDNWTDTDLITGVRWSNRPFEPPASKWASIDIRFAPSRNAEISTNMSVKRTGNIFVDLYAPVDSGTGTLTTSCDSVLAIFENKLFDRIHTLAAYTRHDGVPNIQGTDPQWYKYSVRVPFWRYEI